ncbi:MAG: Sec-independent protein translocase protein TatB [Gammaproteobacteria bacterium]
MFDIGFWELAVIGIVALIVVGPEKMPSLIRTAGQWAGQVQRMARDLRREIELEAETEEYQKLSQDFLAEDRRLKEMARNQLEPKPVSPAADAAADAADAAAEPPLADEPGPQPAVAAAEDTKPAAGA